MKTTSRCKHKWKKTKIKPTSQPWLQRSTTNQTQVYRMETVAKSLNSTAPHRTSQSLPISNSIMFLLLQIKILTLQFSSRIRIQTPLKITVKSITKNLRFLNQLRITIKSGIKILKLTVKSKSEKNSMGRKTIKIRFKSIQRNKKLGKL